MGVCRRGGHWEPDESQSVGTEEPPPPHPQWKGVWGAAQWWVRLLLQQQPILLLLPLRSWPTDSWVLSSGSQRAGCRCQSCHLHPSPGQRGRHQERESRYQQAEEWYENGETSQRGGVRTKEAPLNDRCTPVICWWKSCSAVEAGCVAPDPLRGDATIVTQWTCRRTDDKELGASTEQSDSFVSCSWSTGCLWRIPVRWPW